jgi:hypothetical protein
LDEVGHVFELEQEVDGKRSSIAKLLFFRSLPGQNVLKTFYVRYSKMFYKLVFVPDKLSLMFVGNDMSVP